MSAALVTYLVNDYEITEPGIYDGMPDSQYHLDPVPAGSLSSSGARKLLPPSCPALYKWDRDHGEVNAAHFDFGKAAHCKVLGVGPEIVEVLADDWRGKAAREARDEAYARGAVPLLTADVAKVDAIADRIAGHPIARHLLTENVGIPEASAFWIDERTDVWRRARFDWLPTVTDGSRLIVPDLKTAVSANPSEFERSAASYGYHQQAAFYLDAIRDLGIDDEPAFVFVVIQKTPPFLVSVVELDRAALALGNALNRRALDIYAECSAADVWPGFADDDVALVSLPYWYTRDAEELIA